MTTYATNITPFAAPTRDRTGPILATITGGVAAFLAIVLIAAGAALFWVSENKTDADGYYTTDAHTYSTPTRALTTESLDIGTSVPDWLFSSDTFGRVRIDPRSADSDKPVFVGIARTRTSTPTSTRSSATRSPTSTSSRSRSTRRRHAGEARPAMPAAQTFWAASSADGRAARLEGPQGRLVRRDDERRRLPRRQASTPRSAPRCRSSATSPGG